MEPIRILHVSDLHLADQPQRHSVLDQYASVKTAVQRALASEIKDVILRGGPGDTKKILQDLLAEDSVASLLDALSRVDRRQINIAIDAALMRMVKTDFSFRDLTVETLKNLSIASSYNPGALDCLCNFVDEESERLDAIIITGDLATTGFDMDLEKGRIFLEGTGFFDQTISGAAPPKMLLPGNHDRYIYTARGFLFAPGGTRFDTILGNHWSGPVQVFEPLRDGKDLSVVIIAADFSLRSKADCTFPLLKLSRLAQGRVYEDILDELVQKTRAVRRQERSERYTPVTLWAIHFPPFFSYAGAGRVGQALNNLTKNLIDEDRLIEKAKEHFVDAILAGHTHEAQDYTGGTYAIRVLCAGTTTQDDPSEKQCQIIEVSRNRIGQPKVIINEYKQDLARSSFTL